MKLHKLREIFLLALLVMKDSWGWTPSSSPMQARCGLVPPGAQPRQSPHPLWAVPGADIEQPPVDDDTPPKKSSGGTSMTAESTGSLATRGKKNEIDFTVAPADVSLSRAYGTKTEKGQQLQKQQALTPNEPPVMSLTLALNNASNRAVRRIILARSWPSAEALNLSLRQVAQAERRAEQEQQLKSNDENLAKCPVPRPILNVLTRKRRDNAQTSATVPAPRSRTDEEYVADQLRSFRDRYGSVPNYDQAEDYLDAVLSLATSGIESSRVPLLEDATHAYHNSYRRLLGVLRTAGIAFETDAETKRRKITKRLYDNDICLSMLDRIQMKHDEKSSSSLVNEQLDQVTQEKSREAKSVTAATATTTIPSLAREMIPVQVEKEKRKRDEPEFEVDADGATLFKPRLPLFRKDKSNNKRPEQDKSAEMDTVLTKDDLGGVLLSAEEPSMTRQLNVLSNIVLRALLFGGDQELLVLAETLDADRAAFVQRWYPATGDLLNDADLEEETRPGVQYLNCLIDLLRDCYDNGIVVDLQPSLPLSQSYANAYERLVAMAVELGSGYLKPIPSEVSKALPKPRTAKEEIGRLALWESRFRQGTPDISPYPEDLEGIWVVRDEIGGEIIGTTKVILKEEGQVIVDPPLEGLRWRLDPGPTHLDTCTFQVLNTDGTILQYRGFIDRGARLEARFSKRAVRIRGSVMFQMRDGSVDYYKDILPINYRDGTTKFVMTKVINDDQ